MQKGLQLTVVSQQAEYSMKSDQLAAAHIFSVCLAG